MQISRKTNRKCAVAELIGKVGRKLEGKETKATGGIVIFVLGNVQQVVAGLVCKWCETLRQQDLRWAHRYPAVE